MSDSSNDHLRIPGPGPGDAVHEDHARVVSAVKNVSPPKPNPPEPSHEPLNVEKTTWQLSPEVQKVIESLTTPTSTASLRLDPESNRLIVEVRNTKTGELIRKLPPDLLIEKATKEGVRGLTLDKVI